jgi:hypothetical protein
MWRLVFHLKLKTGGDKRSHLKWQLPTLPSFQAQNRLNNRTIVRRSRYAPVPSKLST